MATYVPKNYREVEAIQLPLAYNKHHLESITKWLIVHAPDHTFSGESTSEGGFVFHVRDRGWVNYLLKPSDYLYTLGDGYLRSTTAHDFEEEYSPKYPSGLIVDGAISEKGLKHSNIVPNPPTNVFGGFR